MTFWGKVCQREIPVGAVGLCVCVRLGNKKDIKPSPLCVGWEIVFYQAGSILYYACHCFLFFGSYVYKTSLKWTVEATIIKNLTTSQVLG